MSVLMSASPMIGIPVLHDSPKLKKGVVIADGFYPPLVKQGASIGAGAVLLPGLTIGEFAVVGAGSLVTRDVPPYVLVLGNPARIRGWVCQCGQRLRFRTASAACSACGRRFAKQEKEDQILKI